MSSSDPCKLLPRGCGVCGKKEDLLRCSGCQVVYYCGQEHQAIDRKHHKTGCTKTKKARVNLEKEEQELRDMPADMFVPDNIFENGVGHFWGIMETRPYMRARYQVVDALLLYLGAPGGRVDAVQTALDHLLDLLRLCRSDNMGVRDVVPALFIRLDRDQEAYDFMKWYATTGEQSDYDWGDMDLPFLDVKDADVFETPLEKWTGEGWLEMSHVVTVTLIKVRILADLQGALNATVAFEGSVPEEIIEFIRQESAGSIVRSRPDMLRAGAEEMARRIETIKTQIKDLYKSVNRYNPHFWKLMLDDPYSAAASRPISYSPKSEEEACLVIFYSLASWIETYRSFDIMRDIIEKA
ncbi:MYND-type zinc finger protein samB [Fusarium sp. LHS14.1]|nr:MYND-type zinc finger protein samB [Fusarium sp. LHS14.1]